MLNRVSLAFLLSDSRFLLRGVCVCVLEGKEGDLKFAVEKRFAVHMYKRSRTSANISLFQARSVFALTLSLKNA